MDRREKEQYLREYGLLKEQGKSFFPYAVLKDSVMAIIVLLIIVAMALTFGAELGPKADPTTTTYVPRPEWYFFFLFELLKVIKPPQLVFLATVGIPTICLVLLLMLPFYDRNSERHPARRPVAMAGLVFAIGVMAYLTYLGANAGAPTVIDEPIATAGQTPAEIATLRQGKQVAAQSGCLACHKLGENGNNGPGPPLGEIGGRLPQQAIARTLRNPTAPMPSYTNLPPKKFDALVQYLASLK